MELEPRQTPTNYLIPLLATAGIFMASQLAFSRKSRNKIRSRDKTCQDNSGTSHLGRLEAAHLDHDKSNPDYDNPDTGILLCGKHHLAQHIDGHGSNGLAKHHNAWAVNMLTKRLTRFIGNKD